MSEELSKTELQKWINEALKNELKNIQIKDILKSAIGEGFVGNVHYVHVTGYKNNKSIDLNLFIKDGNVGATRRNGGCIRSNFQREIYMYEVVFPKLHQLELQKGISEHFDSYPKFYKGLVYDDNEVLVLENLKSKGYQLTTKLPMNFFHKEMLIKEYAKYHALNLAFRSYYPEEFDELVKDLNNLLKVFFQKHNVDEIFFQSHQENLKILEKHKKIELLEKLNHFDEDYIKKLLFGKELDCGPYSAIVHADNFYNNFLFQYKDRNFDVPEKVSIIDWQIAFLSSPIYDILKVFYVNTDPEEFDSYKSFIDIYYDYLSMHLQKLGCDPNVTFPKQLIYLHWKQFARESYFMIYVAMEMKYVDKNSIPENAEFKEMLNFRIIDQEKYEKEVVLLIKHFVENSLI